MPRVMVINNEDSGHPSVLLDEQVSSVHLDSEHSAWQFVERLAWAIGDAEAASAVPAPRTRRRRSAPARAGVAALLALFAVALLGIATATAGAAPTAPPPLSNIRGIAAPGDDIFVTPTGDSSTYANGPEILNRQGTPLWFHPVPQGQTAADFRAQKYKGQPVLTWWQGTGLGGLSSGTDYIYNYQYQPLATVQAGNGLSADGHEFLITPWNTALILSYTTATANLTDIGGPPNQTVINGVVQEIDIATGRVLFQWNSADHVPFAQSEQPLPASPSTPWDWFHVNAVHLDGDDNLLIDARNTWSTYDVSRYTGNVVWQLGGKDSSFALQAATGQSFDSAGEIFAWQHDPEWLGGDEYSFFDNESSGTPLLPSSRAVIVKLDPETQAATLVRSFYQPEGLAAASQGNAQSIANGGLFVGWGALPYITEFGENGGVVFNAQFPSGVNTYRAYLLQWQQATPPPAADAQAARRRRKPHRS